LGTDRQTFERHGKLAVNYEFIGRFIVLITTEWSACDERRGGIQTLLRAHKSSSVWRV